MESAILLLIAIIPVLLLILVAAIIYAAYQLRIIRTTLKDFTSKSSSTLNAAFTEQEIDAQRSTHERYLRDFEFRYEHGMKLKERMKDKHIAEGGTPENFVPDENIKYQERYRRFLLKGEEETRLAVKKMIESNIACLSGRAIEDVREEFSERFGAGRFVSMDGRYQSPVFVTPEDFRAEADA